jgi:hypothetical protein
MSDTCEHCGTKAAPGMLKRWHGDNCKHKPKEVIEPVIETKGEKVMSMFVEVNSVEKCCSVIINLDHIVEIAPLVEGGCALFVVDPNVPGGRSQFKVSDSYDQFKQFALQTVSADDIAKKIAKLKGE